MSSWFNVPDSFKDLTHKVQQALPKIDAEMIEKLTLTTPELTAERQRIDQEERRKEEIKDMLAGMLPWETRDPERDILVDECKEAILLLSADKETFFGPYHMPGKKVKLKEEKNKDKDGDGSPGAADAAADDDEDGDLKPPNDSLEKLAKLEPLPVLLRDFDLNAHVGLINRLLKEDPKLVQMQSSLSGGGEREHIFWKNYFFHCAYTRYEAGLSIDEIWSDQPPEHITVTNTTTAAEKNQDSTAEEETITFDTETNEAAAAMPEKAFPSDPTTDSDAPFSSSSSRHGSNSINKETSTSKDAGSVTPSAGGASEGASDYDMVADATGDASGEDDGDDDNLDAADYELDELEAEIARELED